MNDVELLFCTYAGHPEIGILIELARDNRRPREACEIALDQLLALCKRELATAGERWTPHYDRALRYLIDKRPVLLTEWWHVDASDELDRNTHWGHIKTIFDMHASFVGLFNSAIARGARMLSDAFDLVSITTSEARGWLQLVPDQEALLEQMHRAADRCLETLAFQPDTLEAQTDIAFVRSVAEAESIDDMDLARVPLELFIELGNPFLPKTTTSP